MKKYALLVIDPQNDFCNPGNKNGNNRGSLYVPNAENDMKNLAKWIRKNKEDIDFIGVTLDLHQPNDISHPNFWMDKDGNFPPPFTPITADEIETGKWTPRFDPKRSLNYVKELEKQGEYPHFIWPVHCLVGSVGAGIFQSLMEAIVEWTEKGKFYQTVGKGTFPFTEHFGAFRAQIPDPERPETQLNQGLIKTLETYQNIYLAGEARSHCVANTLKQILEEAADLAPKFVVLTDAMSNVTGFEHIADSTYQKAEKMGVRFKTTNDKMV